MMVLKPKRKKVKQKAKKTSLKVLQSPQLKIQNDHKKLIRTIFKASGFTRLSDMEHKEFDFKGSKSDFDDVFVFQNIIVVAEYTVHQESEVSAHLKKKKVVFDKITEYSGDFVDYLSANFSVFKAATNPLYDSEHYKIIVLYCSKNAIKESLKAEVPLVKYFDYGVAQYFFGVTKTIFHSARFELFEYFGLSSSEVGENVGDVTEVTNDDYNVSILPESHSNFGSGFKVVTFYIDPSSLLERVYVLRRDGWRGSGFYQRMIDHRKLEKIRTYLIQKKRVFINNIIVTLPAETQLLTKSGGLIDSKKILKTTSGQMRLPRRFSSVGIIDGQHRVYSYNEGGRDDDKIAILRKRQNLLVTGIVFPAEITEEKRIQFEANLFLEINTNQSSAKSDLKQEIGLILKPFALESIAKSFLNHLNDGHGPLSNEFQRFFYEKRKIKTTSIVSYGLRPIVKLNGVDSFFAIWPHPDKLLLLEHDNIQLLRRYIEFGVQHVNWFFAAAKMNLGSACWTADKSVTGGFLNTTNINGMIGCLRRIVGANKTATFEVYGKKLKEISDFDFSKYKSSQYTNLADDLFNAYFNS